MRASLPFIIGVLEFFAQLRIEVNYLTKQSLSKSVRRITDLTITEEIASQKLPFRIIDWLNDNIDNVDW